MLFEIWLLIQTGNFSWFPTQLVHANKDNFNAQFKTQKESCLNWLDMFSNFLVAVSREALCLSFMY